MGVTVWVLALLGCVVVGSSLAQMGAPPQPPSLSPRRHFSWRRNVKDELVREKAFAVENPDVQVVALISRDAMLAEAGNFFGSVSVYDFSAPTPLAAIKPYFQGQPCFLLPPPVDDFNSTLAMLIERNGGQVNATGPHLELTAGDFPITNRERSQVFATNPVLLRLCSRQPIFRCNNPDPLAYDPYLATESEQLTFSVLTLEGSATLTFTWEALTR
ncbi:uncharacterized protein [Littorina saxatilis]|uniref:Uncharacterized protein n=1 Tax=Littorina saxatilis TaxID=31220 RepID=A0AAN9FVL9_9CAEN